MSKRFTHTRLLIASKNTGKVQEIQELLSEYNVQLTSAANSPLEEPEETGSSFVENAELKAKYYAEHIGLPALADDSGLCVDALEGAPGIYSARWGGENKDFNLAMKRVEEEMKGTNNLSARFVCALSLYWPEEEHVESFVGKVEGTIQFPPKGDKGFGYDPIFVPKGYDQTFAELSHEIKQRISHRADAFNQLIQNCFNG
jgi:XTP/dITP diphosphohydrolase